MCNLRRVFSTDITLARSPEDVWRALTRWEDAHHWMGDIEDVRADGPTVAGTRIVFTARGRARESLVTTADSGRRLVLRSEQGAVVAEYRYALTPTRDGTRLSLDVACGVRGLLILMGPVIRSAIRKADRGQLDRLAARLR